MCSAWMISLTSSVFSKDIVAVSSNSHYREPSSMEGTDGHFKPILCLMAAPTSVPGTVQRVSKQQWAFRHRCLEAGSNSPGPLVTIDRHLGRSQKCSMRTLARGNRAFFALLRTPQPHTKAASRRPKLVDGHTRPHLLRPMVAQALHPAGAKT